MNERGKVRWHAIATKKAHESRSIISRRAGRTYVCSGNTRKTQTKLMHVRSRVIARNNAQLSVTVDIVIKPHGPLFSASVGQGETSCNEKRHFPP